MGEALTLDGIVNSIDAELVAKGTSAKGPNRGAIVRHGRYTLWGFEGGVDDMTDQGRALLVNTVFYAARQANSPVLEKRLHGTRDDPFEYLDLHRTRIPGLLETLKGYLPRELGNKTADEVEKWLIEKRPYLRSNGRAYEVDTFAESMGVPNHKRVFLERCIVNLRESRNVEETVAELVRYTDRKDIGTSADGWQKWYDDNKDYLFFSDTEGFRFKIDEEAKAKGIPSERLRRWSSEDINYRSQPVVGQD
jgi:hypothetical protein